MEKMDYIVIGAGFAGATFANQVKKKRKKCIIFDKRPHIGGNAYTRKQHHIDVHEYGLHAFHTNDTGVWAFVNEFSSFNNYHHIVRSSVRGQVFPVPINLMTMQLLWGAVAPEEARERVEAGKEMDFDDESDSVERWCLENIGRELYETFVRDYTYKQWHEFPNQLPSSIIRRLPLHYTYQEGYFADTFQGIPTEGYTRMFEHMLDGIPLHLGTDYLQVKNEVHRMYPNAKLVFTGACDELYGYDLGRLEYRSLRFDHQVKNTFDFQGVAQMNYPSLDVDYTRIIEHKHMNRSIAHGNKTVVTYEYPQDYTEGTIPYYPIETIDNRVLARKYQERAAHDNILLLGRLANYRYYNMDQVIAEAMRTAELLT